MFLECELAVAADGGAYFDDLTLTPEPTTRGLLLIGRLAMLGRRR